MTNPLAAERRYTVRFKPGLLTVDELAFDFNPSRLRSEAVHVNQVGFRPDDPVKLAFLSCWMGSGGNLAYPASLSFGIVDDETGDVVYSGKTTLAKAAAEAGNKTKTDVHEMDFSEFTERRGHFRLRRAGAIAEDCSGTDEAPRR